MYRIYAGYTSPGYRLNGAAIFGWKRRFAVWP
jgi:hypothetical protein